MPSTYIPSSVATRYAEYRHIIDLARNAAAYKPSTLSAMRMAAGPHRRVLCKPQSVSSALLLGKLIAVAGYRAVFDPLRQHDFSVHVASPLGRPVLNGRHIDNRKSRVAEAWERAAGYALAVDPLTFVGLIVEKSEANATHDGRVVRGPLAPADLRPGKVYQRLIDNSEGNQVVDIRVPIYRGAVPLVYLKRRPLDDRFSNSNTMVEIKEPRSVLNADELAAISRFAALAGLDYGEADVLRDNYSGLIYVVDSTNGPAGPPNGLPPVQARYAVQSLAAAFSYAAEAAIAGNERDGPTQRH